MLTPSSALLSPPKVVERSLGKLYDVRHVKPHEEVCLEYAKELARTIWASGLFKVPVIVERTHGVLLDGHHRYYAMSRILRAKYIPALVIDYDDPSLSTITSWREGVTIFKHDVIAAGLQGALMPQKTSKHDFHFLIENTPVLLNKLIF